MVTDLLLRPKTIDVDQPYDEWAWSRVAYPAKGLGAWGFNSDLRVFDDEQIDLDPFIGRLIEERCEAPFRKDWIVASRGQTPADTLATALVRWVCENIDFDKICAKLNHAIFTGRKIAVIDWVYQAIELNPKKRTITRNCWVPANIYLVDERRLVFLRPEHSDPGNGNLHHERCEARWLTETASEEGIPFPINSAIIHSYGALKGEPYGRGVFLRLLWTAKFKKQVLKFGLPALDAKALPYLTYEDGRVDEADLTKAKEALTQFYKIGWMTIPDGVTINFLERFHAGRLQSIQDFLNWCDEQTAMSILGQTLTSKTQDNADRGDTRVHYQVGEDRAKSDADLLSNSLTRYLWGPLIQLNIANAQIPTVYRNFTPQLSTLEQAQVDSELVKQQYRRTLKSLIEIYGEGFELMGESGSNVESKKSTEKDKPKP